MEKIKKNFHNNKITKEGPQYIWVSVILLDFIFRACKNYYPQLFLEESEYIIREKNIHKCIIDDVEISSDSDEKTLPLVTLENVQTYFEYLMVWAIKSSDN